MEVRVSRISVDRLLTLSRQFVSSSQYAVTNCRARARATKKHRNEQVLIHLKIFIDKLSI